VITVASWRKQEATRQAQRRDVNETTEHVGGGMAFHRRVDDFVCECGDPNCATNICLSPAEYESVRAYPNHFAIATNHENPDAESVVSENDRYAVVATLAGEASKVALRTDPRGLYARS
jgi:hypothetical protein